MDIPAQLREAIATLSADELDEIQHLIERLPADDEELETLINENLDSLIQALKGESDTFPIAC